MSDPKARQNSRDLEPPNVVTCSSYNNRDSANQGKKPMANNEKIIQSLAIEPVGPHVQRVNSKAPEPDFTLSPAAANKSSKHHQASANADNTTQTTTRTTNHANHEKWNHRSQGRGVVRDNNPPPGPRAVFVPGPGFHLHQQREDSSDGSFSQQQQQQVPHTNHAESNDRVDFVVPMATVVTERSTKFVQATEADTSCFGRLGRRGCFLLVLVQVVAVVVVIVVVVLLVGGGRKGNDKPEEELAVSTLAPTTQRRPDATASTTMSETRSPTKAPVNPCKFQVSSFQRINSEFAFNVPVCRYQPSLLELVLTGDGCDDAYFCKHPETICQDFPENGVIPLPPSKENVVVRFPDGGTDQVLSPGDSMFLWSSNDGSAANHTVEIHRNEPPYNNSTILQRVQFEISCNDQILCFRSLGALAVDSYTNLEQNAHSCQPNVTALVHFDFTISIAQDSFQGIKDMAIIDEVILETNFADPPIVQPPLDNVVLTISNQSVGFSIQEIIDVWQSQTFSASVWINGSLTEVGNECFGSMLFEIPVDGLAEDNNRLTACPTTNTTIE